MKRIKSVYNLWSCHAPVNIPFTGEIPVNETYVEYADYIAMGFKSAGFTFEQTTSSDFILRTASRTHAARTSFIYKLRNDSVVFSGASDAFS
jgi:hypothetical protein